MPNRLILILLISTLIGARSADSSSPSRQGKDFALFFAVDTYQDPAWTDLNNPVRDAVAIAEELKRHFGFETEIHRNPSLSKIQDVIIQWQEKRFSDDAQLFIFFSGHGSVNPFDNEGYFMPVNADKKNKNHLSLLSLRQAVNQIPCPHILLAVDACYSGTILEKGDEDYRPAPRRLGETTETRRARVINTELTYPSRYILTSGGRERTPDGKYHSPFTEGMLNALAQSLREDGLVIWEQLAFQMRTAVGNPQPRYGTFDGHRIGGGFVFVRTDMDTSNPMDQIPLPKMIEIPGGSFEMGDENGFIFEKPVHRIEIIRFELSETEITNAQFCTFLNAMGNQEEGGVTWLDTNDEFVLINNKDGTFHPISSYENHPVVGVSWYAAQAYCNWLSELSGEDYRLPTEAEWEYAAGGGSRNRTRWAGTNDYATLNLWKYANYGYRSYSDDSFAHKRTAPVKTLLPNRLGLYDMSGNVWEWCSDYFDDTYYQYCVDNNIVHDPLNTSQGDRVVVRGGAWDQDDRNVRVSHRRASPQEARNAETGFRLVKSLP